MQNYQKLTKKMSLCDRFNSSYEIDADSGCWNWVRSLRGRGYGAIRVNGKTQIASRVSYQLHIGTIPIGYVVCHRCNNTKCVNPDHLYAGTYSENTRQAVSEGRQFRASGETNGSAKLTSEIVYKIRQDMRSQRTIAAVYGISQLHVSRIKRRLVWSHLD